MYHDYKNLNKDNLERDLNNASWDTAFESKVLMKFLIYWKKCLMRFLIAIIIPLKTKRVKRQTQPAWMTTEVHKSIKTWEKLLRRVWKTNKSEDWNHYSNAKCRTAKVKTIFFFWGSWRKLRESWRYLECPKWLWQTNDWSRGIRDGKWTVYDESSLANEFNDFFTKTLEQLIKDDHPSDSVFDDSKWKKLILFHPGLAPLQVLSYLKPQEVADIISKILVNKATGHDGLSAKILKLITPSFIHPFCRPIELINCNKYLPW